MKVCGRSTPPNQPEDCEVFSISMPERTSARRDGAEYTDEVQLYIILPSERGSMGIQTHDLERVRARERISEIIGRESLVVLEVGLTIKLDEHFDHLRQIDSAVELRFGQVASTHRKLAVAEGEMEGRISVKVRSIDICPILNQNLIAGSISILCCRESREIN